MRVTSFISIVIIIYGVLNAEPLAVAVALDTRLLRQVRPQCNLPRCGHDEQNAGNHDEYVKRIAETPGISRSAVLLPQMFPPSHSSVDDSIVEQRQSHSYHCIRIHFALFHKLSGV